MIKKSIMSLMMLAGVFAFANNGNGDTKNSEPKPTNDQTIVVETSEEKIDEALYCSIIDKDGNKITCWFCNCNDLAKTVLDAGKKTNGSSDSN